MTIDSASLFDISTTQNNLPGKHECPVQIVFEALSFHPDDLKQTFFKPWASDFRQVVPDEPVLPGGIIQLGENPDFSNGKYENLKDGLKRVYGLFLESKDAGHYFIAYNMAYDMRILNEHFIRILEDEPISIPDNSIIDVMVLVNKLIPVDKISSYSEKNVLVYLYGFSFLKKLSEKLTGSKLDSAITKFILLAFCKQKGFKNFKEIHDFIVAPSILEVFPFGKHKGEKISDVAEKDFQYIQWLSNSKEIMERNPDLKFTLDKFIENDVGIGD